jgi:hypothetical protein
MPSLLGTKIVATSCGSSSRAAPEHKGAGGLFSSCSLTACRHQTAVPGTNYRFTNLTRQTEWLPSTTLCACAISNYATITTACLLIQATERAAKAIGQALRGLATAAPAFHGAHL